jgi:hypothetical protein
MKKNGLLILLAFIVTVFGQELRTVQGEYTYQYSDNETIVQARDAVRRLALTDAVSKFATYIESRGIVENYMTVKETIISTAMGFVQNVKILEQTEDRNVSTIFMRVSCELNEEKVLDLLKKTTAAPEDSRQKEIKDFIYLAINAEKDNRVADALKYYYWALVLFRNEKNQKSITIPEFNNMSITVAIPDRINRIMAELDFSVDNVVEKEDSKTVTVKISRKSQTIENLDFKYFQIDDWSPLVSSRSGSAYIELSEAEKNQKKIKIAVEYAYTDRASFDPELEKYLVNANIWFNNSEFQLELAGKIKNNISEIKKDFPAEPVNEPVQPAPIAQEEVKSSKKWWYIGGGAAVLVGVGIALLAGGDDDEKESTSTSVEFEVDLP